jgi:hypothetical protein
MDTYTNNHSTAGQATGGKHWFALRDKPFRKVDRKDPRQRQRAGSGRCRLRRARLVRVQSRVSVGGTEVVDDLPARRRDGRPHLVRQRGRAEASTTTTDDTEARISRPTSTCLTQIFRVMRLGSTLGNWPK